MSQQKQYELVDEYLDDLYKHLARAGASAKSARRFLFEAESHLKDATDDAVATGVSSEDAQRKALARFGSVADVAKAPFASRSLKLSLLGESGAAAMQLTWVAFTCLAASALVALLFVAAFGKSFVFGAPHDAAFLPAQCAHWMSVQPGAQSCLQAHEMENFDDSILLRGVAAGLAVVVLAASVVIHKRLRAKLHRLLPPAFVATLGTAVFGIATLVLDGYALDQALNGALIGTGLIIATAVCTLVPTLGYGTSMARTVLNRADTLPA